MPLLTRDAILQADDLEVEEVEIPEWGGTVRVRALTGKDRDAFEASMFRQKGKEQVRDATNVRAKLAVKVVVDENGERIFADTDAPALGAKSAAPIDRIFEVAARLSRLKEEDVEELAGNSDAAPSGDSFSG